MIIKNGRVIDPASGKNEIMDLMIEDGKVLRMAPQIEAEGDTEVMDATGLLVAPGLVDVHVHFREPGFTAKEDIDTGAHAAAAGGFTSVILMANTKPCVDNTETLEYIINRGADTDIHVYTCANVTMGMKGQEITPMEELAAAGAVGFTDDGIPLLQPEIVRAAMERCKKMELPVSFHEEDPKYIANNGIHRGKASAHFGIGGSPREAEITMVERDLKLALETGAAIDIQHISTAEAVELVRQAKKKGDNIHAEATPHHFTLTEEAAIQYGTLAKMNPPLREESDRQAIIRGLADGTIDMIATDHAPHTVEEKSKPITEAPSGIIGLETALALGLTELVATDMLSIDKLIELMSTNPAKLYKLDAGYIAEGGPADLILIDPTAKWCPEAFRSKACNTPFKGYPMTGRVVRTICKGKVVYEA